MRISDWSSDVCSSDLEARRQRHAAVEMDQDAVAFDIDAIDGRREARRAGDPTGEKRKNKGHEPILPRPVRTGPAKIHGRDRKSTRLNSITNAHLVCRLLLEKKKKITQ